MRTKQIKLQEQTRQISKVIKFSISYLQSITIWKHFSLQSNSTITLTITNFRNSYYKVC